LSGYKGHITIAAFFGAGLAVGLAFFTTIGETLPVTERVIKGLVIVWLAVIFGLFPDVDIKSKGQLLFYRLFFLLDLGLLLLGRWKEAALLGFLAIVPILSRHRGWTHSFLAMLLVPLPILVGPMYLSRMVVWDGLPYYLGAVAGYFSHLVADGMVISRPRTRRAAS